MSRDELLPDGWEITKDMAWHDGHYLVGAEWHQDKLTYTSAIRKTRGEALDSLWANCVAADEVRLEDERRREAILPDLPASVYICHTVHRQRDGLWTVTLHDHDFNLRYGIGRKPGTRGEGATEAQARRKALEAFDQRGLEP